MIFTSEGNREWERKDYLRLLALPAHDRFGVDESIKARMRSFGINTLPMYPDAGRPTFDDVTIWSFDQTTWTFDEA